MRASSSASDRPSTEKTLTLDRAPERRVTVDRGTRSACATARLASSVARPPSGGTATRTTI